MAPAAHAAQPGPGVQRINYMVGPIDVTPGQNRIAYRPVAGEKPPVDGWITRIKPNLVRADGSVPPTNQVMFHHGVWLNLSAHDTTIPSLPQRFFATGEEKTTMTFPKGFGLRYHASDVWLLNHMIHNLTPRAMTLYVSYTIDFIPDSSPAAAGMRPLRPVWLDVQNGSFYPVFDVHRGSGKNGRFTYPTQADNPYPDGVAKNLWQVDRDGVLVAGAGHLHSGGLYSDLYLRRSGARYRGPRCETRATARLRARCRRQAPSVRGNRVHLFRSNARYWEPFGPVSWDMAMKVTPPNWRVAVKKGDILENTATYESKRASWYESMGIEIFYMADGPGGKNPYRTKVDLPGRVTHGHLAENSDHGGRPTDLADPRLLPAAGLSPNPLAITQFSYAAGDLNDDAPYNRPATVKRGQSLTFQLSQRDASQEIWHSITSCAAPCNRSTGIAYPIADGRFQFDSGQLGTITPAVGRTTWQTPKNLPVGTYTYFCRIHPFMRGSFRVTK
jgi:plastocyanin